MDATLAMEVVDPSATSATGERKRQSPFWKKTIFLLGLVKPERERRGEREWIRERERESLVDPRERSPNNCSFLQIFTFVQVWPLCPRVQRGGGPLLQVSW